MAIVRLATLRRWKADQRRQRTGTRLSVAQSTPAPAPVEHDGKPLTDTALIQAYCYEDDQRHAATVEALRHIAKLCPMPVLHFGDLSYERHEDIAAIVEGCGGTYHFFQRRPEHDYVFHKEDIYNAVTAILGPEIAVLLYLDADTYPLHTWWAHAARAKVMERGDDWLIQPWSEFADTADTTLAGWSMCRRIRHDADQWLTHANPGLCNGMTRGCFDSIGGFPTACPAGASDTMLMLEISGGKYRVSYMDEFSYFAEGFRSVPTKQVDYIVCPMVHVHHGSHVNRCYRTRHQILQAFWPFGADMYKDSDGLLCVRSGSALQYCLARRRRCHNSVDVARLLNEAGMRVPVVLDVDAYKAERDKDRAYCTGRWGYLRIAGEMIHEAVKTGEILEVGPRNLPLVHDATYMDITPEWQPAAVIHDAGVSPWPFEDWQFAAVVALQVVEHLAGRQAVFFREASRVARWLIVSVPWQWHANGPEPDHDGIDWSTIAAWTGGVDPVRYEIDASDPTHKRIVLLYNAADFSTEAAQ